VAADEADHVFRLVVENDNINPNEKRKKLWFAI